MTRRITVNGKEYASVEEMPPDARQAYERAMQMLADRDRDGVPDLLQSSNTDISTDTHNPTVSVTTSSRYVIDGHEYRRREDIPEHLRQMIPGLAERSKFASQGGITIRLSWSTLLALLAAVLAVLIGAWLVLRH